MFRVLGEKVLIQPDKIPEKTASGIVLPGNAQPDGPLRGTVVGVGRGSTLPNGALRTPEVKNGDVVLYNPLSGVTIEDTDGAKYHVIVEHQIIAVAGQ